MKSYNKDCRGCYGKYNNVYECLLKYQSDLVSQCPCAIRLVKPVCAFQCDKRLALFAKQSDETVRDLFSKKLQRWDDE